jgi:uncharacterized protein
MDAAHHSGLPFALTPERVVQTHCSLVLIAGERVFKLKKPVKFPFLDYSTLELRRRFCLEEVRLNRRFSPRLYLGVSEVREQDGLLTFSEPADELTVPGPAVRDYAVLMRRVPDGAWLADLVRAGSLTPAHLRGVMDLLTRVWAGQGNDPSVAAAGLPENLRHNTVANIAECERFAPECLSREAWQRLDALLRGWFEANPEVFSARVEQGRIRDGHGDLKPTNVAFEDGRPLITDCIEFRDDFRRLDTLCETSFLAVGLEALGAFHHAADLYRAYAEAAGDAYPDPLRRYYQAHLACVMGKVTALQLDEPGLAPARRERVLALARHCFALADFHAREPHVVMVGGLIGTGKSTLAAALAASMGWPQLNSDRVRKELHGVAPTDRLPPEAYTDESALRVYDRLADAVTSARSGLVLDAQFPAGSLRTRVLAAARRRGANVLLLWLDGPDELLRARLANREADPTRVSDAGAGLLQAARARLEPPTAAEGVEILHLDAGLSADRALAPARRALLGEAFDPAVM